MPAAPLKIRGNRTYAVCVLMLVFAAAGLLLGRLTGEQAVQLVLQGLAILFLRAGIPQKK